MNYHELLHRDIRKGETIAVIQNRVSYDSGVTWATETRAEILRDGETPPQDHSGPSTSFGGELRSGRVDVSYRRWDGKRWRHTSI